MLVTETIPFQGSRVRFPVKALRFFLFESFFSRKSTLDTGCFKAGFSPEFPFSGIPGFPCLVGTNLGECEAVVRAKQKGVDKVGHSDAIGRERRPYRRGTSSFFLFLPFRSGLHRKTHPMPCKGQRGLA